MRRPDLLVRDVTGAERHLLATEAEDGRVLLTVADDHERSLSLILDAASKARLADWLQGGGL